IIVFSVLATLGKLGALKEKYSNIQIMALTSTLFEEDIIDEELCFLVLGKKDTSLEQIKQLMDLIKDVKKTNYAKIYCTRVKDCLEVQKMLNSNIKEKILESGVKQADTKEEILDMLKVVEALYKKNDKLIIPLGMIEVFSFLKNKQLQNKKLNLELDNHKTAKVLNTKVLVELALANLVCFSLVK
ncbi:7686_t:CDS:2, partial [Gigaspora margarita]